MLWAWISAYELVGVALADAARLGIGLGGLVSVSDTSRGAGRWRGQVLLA